MSEPGGSTLDRAQRGFRSDSLEDLIETARLTRNENPRWRLVLPVTRGTREFIYEQMPALVTTYAVAIALIFATACIERVLPPWLIALWVAESVASITARVLLVRRVFRASTVEVACRRGLRLLPVLAILLAAIHWSWSATVFIGPHLSLTTVVMLLTYVMLSIACLGLAPASPVICAAYLVPMWGATTWMLAASDWASGAVLLAVVAALTGVLWSAFYIVISGVRRNLVRSDEVDLLMNELRQRNSEVEVLRAAAAADLETRATVFASASHDLRQRIHALKLLAHMSAGTASANGPMRRMASAIEELEVFVTDVLQFVRFDSSSRTERLSVVPLQEALQSIELQFEALVMQRGARLRTRATSLRVRTDAVMLGRVLENLVSNAVKFTRKDVLVVARRRGDEVCLEVWDQGKGLDQDRLQSGAVARPSPDAREHHKEGFGLGLMIVRRLVEALGYRIEAHSKPDRGTRVRIVIPAKHVISEGQG